MKCQTCLDDGLRSTVQSHESFTTCMGYSTYWDEDGIYHSHDPNITTTSYSCSQDHKWTEQQTTPCPTCGYRISNG